MSSGPHGEPYVLSTLVMPAHANHLGVMHGGHMMSWMDMAAWVVATRAVSRRTLSRTHSNPSPKGTGCA